MNFKENKVVSPSDRLNELSFSSWCYSSGFKYIGFGVPGEDQSFKARHKQYIRQVLFPFIFHGCYFVILSLFPGISTSKLRRTA